MNVNTLGFKQKAFYKQLEYLLQIEKVVLFYYLAKKPISD